MVAARLALKLAADALPDDYAPVVVPNKGRDVEPTYC